MCRIAKEFSCELQASREEVKLFFAERIPLRYQIWWYFPEAYHTIGHGGLM